MSKNKINYRKIWESVYGKIPMDQNGRSYEIHHTDGNRSNNSLENLVCVSIEDHYKIHFERGDYFACASITKRMKLSEDQRKELSQKISDANKSRPNPFNDPEIQKKCKESWKARYVKENHPYHNKKRPEHSEYMKSIGFGKTKTAEQIKNHRTSWIESTKDNPIRAKTWSILKDGVMVEIKNLKKFCRDNNLSFSKIYNGKEDQGYKLL